MANITKPHLSIQDQPAVFGHLRQLVGRWQGVTEAGDAVLVDYEMTANHSVLVEHWLFHTKVEALTLYHLDGVLLIARHYCPIGNQPRLDLLSVSDDGVIEFEFVSATNLPDPDIDHAHQFDLKIIDADTMHRNETYLEKQIADSNGTTFTRISA